MKTENEKDSFHFTYSAKEQEELKRIRQKYQPQEETKMDRLRRLDKKVGQKATMKSIIIGVIGALVMGMGMSITMTDIGEKLGMTRNLSLTAGILIGLVGIVCVCLAYPVYSHILKQERERMAPEILRLTEELMK